MGPPPKLSRWPAGFKTSQRSINRLIKSLISITAAEIIDVRIERIIPVFPPWRTYSQNEAMLTETVARKLMNPKRTAAVLGITEVTLSVWRCTRRYDLPHIKVGSRVMYDPEDVLNFIARRRCSNGFPIATSSKCATDE